MAVLLAHPTGNANVRQVLQALLEAGAVAEFVTSVAFFGGPLSRALLRTPFGGELSRRVYDARLADRTSQTGAREWLRLIATRQGWRGLTRHESGLACVDAVYRDVARLAARRTERNRNATTVYAYEDGALEIFQAAQARGLRRIYDLPIAYWRTAQALLREEAERRPAWEPTLVGTEDTPAKLARKDAELALAEVVICPSQFVLDSLPAEVAKRVPVVMTPFGSPSVSTKPLQARPADQPFKVLFVGLLTQRKGLADLFEAVRLLGPSVELHLLGAPVVPLEFYRAQGVPFIYHAPTNAAGVRALMEQCDALALPSLVEGRALVQQEALASGLPIIVTPNAGAQDLVEDGQAGTLVPIRQPEAIAAAIEAMRRDPAAHLARRHAARAKAASLPWAHYRALIRQAVLGK